MSTTLIHKPFDQVKLLNNLASPYERRHKKIDIFADPKDKVVYYLHRSYSMGVTGGAYHMSRFRYKRIYGELPRLVVIISKIINPKLREFMEELIHVSWNEWNLGDIPFHSQRRDLN